MARAFSIFANQGREVTPMAIRSVEDRNGLVVLDPERDIRLRQRQMGSGIQVVSPQNAYIMTSMLKKTVEAGTLASPVGDGSKLTFQDANGKNFRMPMAGKTGTPQNWSDAWTVGYSAYYTTAIWFGFDRPGNSLGVNLSGATLAGPVWADYMREIHQGLPFKDFVRPASGLIDVTVCAKSGLLKTPACNQGEVTLPFLEGTQPVLYCDVHGNAGSIEINLDRIRTNTIFIDDSELLKDLTIPTLPQEFQNDSSSTRRNTTRRNSNPGRTAASGRTSGSRNSLPAEPSEENSEAGSTGGGEYLPDLGIELPAYNFLLE
jgi:penicillin-binding protein 1A